MSLELDKIVDNYSEEIYKRILQYRREEIDEKELKRRILEDCFFEALGEVYYYVLDHLDEKNNKTIPIEDIIYDHDVDKLAARIDDIIERWRDDTEKMWKYLDRLLENEVYYAEAELKVLKSNAEFFEIKIGADEKNCGGCLAKVGFYRKEDKKKLHGPPFHPKCKCVLIPHTREWIEDNELQDEISDFYE